MTGSDDGRMRPIGVSWRSAKWFVVGTVAVALFIESFLYGFLVPILPYMLENRLQVDPSQTQRLTSAVLALHGFVSTISGPVIGHFADKTSSRKIPLLLSLAACVAGTILVACSTALPALFLGRVLQGLAGSAAWIVGLATVASTLGKDNMGAVMGLIMAFANAGMISGPMVSGVLLEVAGYWLTWCVPLAILCVDIIARLLMIESPIDSISEPCAEAEPSERDSLLPPKTSQQTTGGSRDASTALGFWRLMLSDSRVVTCLLIASASTGISTSFHTTLPIHAKEAFGWNSGHIGFMFFLLSVPAIILSSLAGFLRDRIGVKIPATVSLFLQAAVMGLLGAAGNRDISWASSHSRGPILFTFGIIAMGTLRPFVSGIGPVELTAAIKTHEEENPGVFGPAGGYSRAFSMTDVAAHAGLTIGPIVSGAIAERFGYTPMSWSLGGLFLVLGTLAIVFLGSKSVDRKGKARDQVEPSLG